MGIGIYANDHSPYVFLCLNTMNGKRFLSRNTIRIHGLDQDCVFTLL